MFQYLDPGMKLKSQKQFVLPKPHHCHSVSTEIEQSEPWKVLKGGAYVEIIEAQVRGTSVIKFPFHVFKKINGEGYIC